MMARFYVLLSFLLLAGCASRPEDVAVAKAAPVAERVTHNATLWSSKTELYLEYPALVKGEGSRFAIHLTRLNDFKPVPTGRSEVRLTYADGTSEIFSSEKPSKAGIFGVTVTPTRAGEVSLKISLSSPALSDSHDIAHVPVHASKKDAPTEEAPATEEFISFCSNGRSSSPRVWRSRGPSGRASLCRPR
jgi:hypothetical protein